MPWKHPSRHTPGKRNRSGQWGYFFNRPRASPGKGAPSLGRIEPSQKKKQILRLPSPVEQWRPSAAAKGEKNKWRTRGEKTHLAQWRKRGGREQQKKENHGRSPWRVGSRSCEPARQLWRYQPTPSFSCCSFLNDGGCCSLIGCALLVGLPPLCSVWLNPALRQPMIGVYSNMTSCQRFVDEAARGEMESFHWEPPMATDLQLDTRI